MASDAEEFLFLFPNFRLFTSIKVGTLYLRYASPCVFVEKVHKLKPSARLSFWLLLKLRVSTYLGAFICFCMVFSPEYIPHGSKRVALINTEKLDFKLSQWNE
jgi:hypothetical protein